MSLGATEKENLFIIIIVKYFFCLSFHSSADEFAIVGY